MESLIQSVLEFLNKAVRLYGDGEAGPPPQSVRLTEVPSISGAGATLFEANATNAALGNRLEGLFDRDEHVGSLITKACDSIECGRKTVKEGTEQLKSSAGALGPFANSPLAMLALAPVITGILGTVIGQMTGDSGQMSDLSEEFPGSDPEGERDSVSLASLRSHNGDVPGLAYALAVEGTPYVWGDWDCSLVGGNVVIAAMGGDPSTAGRLFTTHNAAGVVRSLGGGYGYGPPGSLLIGVSHDGPGHMGLTLPNGTPVENRSGDGVVVGPYAAGALDPQFEELLYIPPERLAGGNAGYPSIAV